MKLPDTQKKQLVDLWVIVTIAVGFALFNLAVDLVEDFRHFFATLRETLAFRLSSHGIFLFVTGMLCFAYVKWKQTAKKRAELEDIIGSISPDALLVTDEHACIVMCNETVRYMFGHETADIIGKEVDLLFTGQSPSKRLLAAHKDIVGSEFHISEETGRKKNGDSLPLEAIIGRLSGNRGAVLLLRDITQRKRAEDALLRSRDDLEVRVRERTQELETTQKKLIRQERLRVVGQMASGVAHDISNALQPILGYVDLIEAKPESLDDKAQLTSYLEIIGLAAKDAMEVARRLYEFARIREEREPIRSLDLNGIVEQSVSLTQPSWRNEASAAGHTIDVKMELKPLPVISGQEVDLREMITNLILNAVDAITKDGIITLRTRVEGDYVALEVSDTGKGMSEEERTRCLEPFFSTKGEQGTGLGLWMVSWIVRRHRASVDIASEEGVGTTFTIRLPAHADKEGVK